MTTSSTMAALALIVGASLVWRGLRRPAAGLPLEELAKIAHGTPYSPEQVGAAYVAIESVYHDRLRTLTCVRAAAPVGCLHLALEVAARQAPPSRRS